MEIDDISDGIARLQKDGDYLDRMCERNKDKVFDPNHKTQQVCDKWTAPRLHGLQTKSLRLMFNIDQNERANTRVQVAAYPPYTPMFQGKWWAAKSFF